VIACLHEPHNLSSLRLLEAVLYLVPLLYGKYVIPLTDTQCRVAVFVLFNAYSVLM
jgi:hypothetical protein